MEGNDIASFDREFLSAVSAAVQEFFANKGIPLTIALNFPEAKFNELPTTVKDYHIKYELRAGTLAIISLPCNPAHGAGTMEVGYQMKIWAASNRSYQRSISVQGDTTTTLDDGTMRAPDVRVVIRQYPTNDSFVHFICEVDTQNASGSGMRSRDKRYFDEMPDLRGLLGIKVWIEDLGAAAVLWHRGPDGEPAVAEAWIFGLVCAAGGEYLGVAPAQREQFERVMANALPHVPAGMWHIARPPQPLLGPETACTSVARPASQPEPDVMPPRIRVPGELIVHNRTQSPDGSLMLNALPVRDCNINLGAVLLEIGDAHLNHCTRHHLPLPPHLAPPPA
eukprot:m.177711 g.177711  ORF g.177711 m.177711 type:complete len:337 (-) comp9973_c1_seq1:58-1068(-)